MADSQGSSSTSLMKKKMKGMMNALFEMEGVIAGIGGSSKGKGLTGLVNLGTTLICFFYRVSYFCVAKSLPNPQSSIFGIPFIRQYVLHELCDSVPLKLYGSNAILSQRRVSLMTWQMP